MPSRPSTCWDEADTGVIRPYRAADLDALYDICLRTGDAGDDASALVSDRRLFGDVYVGSYAAFAPELTFVVEDDEAVGYVLGALDTAAFGSWCESEWWPPLRTAHPADSGATPLDELLIGLIHHPHVGTGEVVARFPSHLHLDLLPSAQGRGWGRRLLAAIEAELRAAGSSGVHFGVAATNERALGFYRHLGYEEHGSDGYSVVFTRAL